jgi:YXWGXW repeat-containing protein
MTRYILPAALAALAFGASAAAYAQTTLPQPMAQPAPNMINASTTVDRQPAVAEPRVNETTATTTVYNQPMAQPAMPGPYMAPGFTPRTVWIPGTFEWDPVRQNYVWIDGRFMEAPTDTAQWVPGHWTETATSWIWIEGRWM